MVGLGYVLDMAQRMGESLRKGRFLMSEMHTSSPPLLGALHKSKFYPTRAQAKARLAPAKHQGKPHPKASKELARK